MELHEVDPSLEDEPFIGRSGRTLGYGGFFAMVLWFMPVEGPDSLTDVADGAGVSSGEDH